MDNSGQKKLADMMEAMQFMQQGFANSFVIKDFLLFEQDKWLTASGKEIVISKSAETIVKTESTLSSRNVINIEALLKSADSNSGKNFVCRVLTPWHLLNSKNSFFTVADDPDGIFGIRLQVPENIWTTKLENLLFPGAMLIIANPICKISNTDDDDIAVSILIENINDISIYHDLQQFESTLSGVKWKGEIPKKYQSINLLAKSSTATPETWRKEGNEFFVRKNYAKALTSYTNGLQKFPNDTDLRYNRSATYLNLRRFILAEKDATLVLSINPNHSKAIFRKTKALCGQKKYIEAEIFLSNEITQKGNNLEKLNDLQQLLKEVKRQVYQSTT